MPLSAANFLAIGLAIIRPLEVLGVGETSDGGVDMEALEAIDSGGGATDSDGVWALVNG